MSESELRVQDFGRMELAVWKALGFSVCMLGIWGLRSFRILLTRSQSHKTDEICLFTAQIYTT